MRVELDNAHEEAVMVEASSARDAGDPEPDHGPDPVDQAISAFHFRMHAAGAAGAGAGWGVVNRDESDGWACPCAYLDPSDDSRRHAVGPARYRGIGWARAEVRGRGTADEEEEATSSRHVHDEGAGNRPGCDEAVGSRFVCGGAEEEGNRPVGDEVVPSRLVHGVGAVKVRVGDGAVGSRLLVHVLEVETSSRLEDAVEAVTWIRHVCSSWEGVVRECGGFDDVCLVSHSWRTWCCACQMTKQNQSRYPS